MRPGANLAMSEAELTALPGFSRDIVSARAKAKQLLADAGVDNVMCLIQMGTLTQDQQLETIRIFGEQVIPHFQARERQATMAQASA